MTTTTEEQKAATERYATLHRAAENGHATDQTWRRMIEVCIVLDKQQEAVDAFHKIEDPALRRGLRRGLARRGWVEAANDASEAQSLMVTDADLSPSARDKLEDGFRFLVERRMRTAVLIGTVAFPLTLVVVGLLTGGSRHLAVQLIALLPALFLLGMVGVAGRHVLRLAIMDLDDADDVPSDKELASEVPRFLVDFAALSAVFLGPAALLAGLGLPLLALPWLAAVAVFMPMTCALRLSGNEWKRLKPAAVWTAIRRTSPEYLRVTGIIVGLFTPAAAAAALTLGMPPFLIISIVGPLAVAPSFVAARMIGLTLHYERERLTDLFTLPRRELAKSPVATTPKQPTEAAPVEPDPEEAAQKEPAPQASIGETPAPPPSDAGPVH